MHSKLYEEFEQSRFNVKMNGVLLVVILLASTFLN